MKPILVLLVMGFGVSAFGQATLSEDNFGSLVPATFRNPMNDVIAARIGDTLTILVSESSAAKLTANTAATKADDNNVPAQQLPLLNQAGLIGKLFDGLRTGMRTRSQSTTGGTGSTDRNGTLTARVTAIVTQVLPNGNLVIEGTRWVQVNKDTQVLRISGVVRRQDVRRDNTVLSESIADARITNDGKGQISDRQRKGILTRIIDWLF